MNRYSLTELKPMFADIIVDYLANDNKLYFKDKVIKEGTNVPEILYSDKDQLAKDIVFRIDDYTNRKNATSIQEEKDVYDKAMTILQEELDRISDVSIEKQKAVYEKTQDVYASHTFITVPLNKKINAFYDDFNLSVCFYDNLTNETGVKEFSALKTSEERKEYVKNHIEVTHIVMSLVNSTQAGIIIEGQARDEYSDPTSSSCEILPSRFAEFNKVTLSECEEIANNDLKQVIQERIDMDKENLEKLAEMNVRGDVYTIYKSKNDTYIRYVCPSTQRVYYNAIDENYLAESEYFHKNDYNSYILAWYSINNLFMDLDEEALALTSPRC